MERMVLGVRLTASIAVASFSLVGEAAVLKEGVEAAAKQATAAKTRAFTFHYRFRVKDLKPADGVNNLVRVLMPAPSSTDCQQVTRLEASAPAAIAEHQEARFGNRILYFETPIPADGQFTVDVPFDVVRREVLLAHLKDVPAETLDAVKLALHL